MSARLLVLAFRTAWAVVPRLPQRCARGLFSLFADLAWLRNGKGVRRLSANLGRVTGLRDQPLRDLTRRAMRSYGRYWCEMFQLSGWDDAEFERRLRVEGQEHLEAALARGGAVLAATHSGNWDLPGAWCGRTYGRATTVGERLKPEALFDAFVAARTKHGIEVLPHVGGERPALTILLERLRAGGLVGLVCDRDLSRRGVEVRFFGATARMAAGPALLARDTASALLPVGIWNEGEQVVFRFHPPVPIDAEESVETIMQRVADVFARDISAHPEDWHMLQRVWTESRA